MTMKAHANYIIFGRLPIGGNLPPPSGGATGIGPSRASAHARIYTDKQILHDETCSVGWQNVYTNSVLITTELYLPWRFGLYQRPSSEELVHNSSCGSCDGSDVTWQEIGRACGSVYSWRRPGS